MPSEPAAVDHRCFLDSGYRPSDDDWVVDMVEGLMRRSRPDLTFAYLCGTDLAGHDHGWGSPEYHDAMVKIDAHLGRLLELVGDDASVLVTTDHGGSGHDHTVINDEVTDVFVVVRSSRLAPGSIWTGGSLIDVAPTVADLAAFEPSPAWQGQSLVGRERPTVDHLIDLLRSCDQHSYGEDVTMLDHALQSAAEMEAVVTLGDGDDELVLAALLHDLGHLVGVAGTHGRPEHAETGATLLQSWLPATVTEPIRLHVAAKRHLVATDPSYADQLSTASQITLVQQGGAMTPAESTTFLAEPHARRAMLLRYCDDLGKRPGRTVAPLEAYRSRIAQALSSAPIDAVTARSACGCAACRDEDSGQRLGDIADLAG